MGTKTLIALILNGVIVVLGAGVFAPESWHRAVTDGLPPPARASVQRWIQALRAGGGVSDHAQPSPPEANWPSTAPHDFEAAKDLLYPIFAARGRDYYCGCAYDRRGRVDRESCGVDSPKYRNRLGRIEMEHVVPASTYKQRACWRNPPEGQSGREYCREVDPEFRRVEADPFSLLPVVGALNAVRLNYKYGEVAGEAREFGRCDFEFDPERRVIEPPETIKGDVARVHFYHEAVYGLRLSRQQRQLFLAWHRMDPVSPEEEARTQAIAQRVGWINPFAAGQEQPQ